MNQSALHFDPETNVLEMKIGDDTLICSVSPILEENILKKLQLADEFLQYLNTDCTVTIMGRPFQKLVYRVITQAAKNVHDGYPPLAHFNFSVPLTTPTLKDQIEKFVEMKGYPKEYIVPIYLKLFFPVTNAFHIERAAKPIDKRTEYRRLLGGFISMHVEYLFPDLKKMIKETIDEVLDDNRITDDYKRRLYTADIRNTFLMMDIPVYFIPKPDQTLMGLLRARARAYVKMNHHLEFLDRVKADA